MAESSHVNGNGAAAVDQPTEDTADCADIDSVCATIGKIIFTRYLLSIDFIFKS
jgi:hypothetical protein